MAVYTEVPEDALAAFLEGYDIGRPVACHGIAEGVENSNFLLKTTQATFILTLYERRVNPDELPWFLGLMQYLARHGLSCPLPVADRQGRTLRTLCGRPAAITTFLPGGWLRQVSVDMCAQVGDALARLHLLGEGYVAERPNSMGPQAWTDLLQACRAGGDDVRPGLVRTIGETLARVLPAWPGTGNNPSLPRGQIHADLFPDNVFFRDGRLSGIIDFYFACTDWYAYDLAITINAWCFDDDIRFVPARARAMVEAYRRVRPLEDAEDVALATLATGAAIRFTLTRLYDWINTPVDALVTRKDPLDYLARMEFFASRMDEGFL
ncbi:homoserine kinase [Komagataeibacter intermedius]|uniref:Homoserine kinase n=2 Tax=Komagataeibacter intermedius TaxID=66229 RepID=A0A0N1FDV2_9PROT|nr:homoserine kinase [Komagataeibacter intermedius]KPH88967.1 homoserine kinase [Komagataeibacter intermedius AF2]MCF3635034.1 homoserine kinase [Komagataeibacter intermedius]GAN88269.1 homoserine kinase [Komagataeibacter intermedius TF2]GBQ66278.1 homoserine kinase [Komagataeibacter intermedius NRIC 0521]